MLRSGIILQSLGNEKEIRADIFYFILFLNIIHLLCIESSDSCFPDNCGPRTEKEFPDQS